MSARNIYHDQVLQALREDGWTITHDPFTLEYGGKDLFVDIGAERAVVGAERGADRIAVEVQSFVQPSGVRALQQAVGQYLMYKAIMRSVAPDRRVYMAVPRHVDEELLSERLGTLMIREFGIKVMVFDHNNQKVVRWIE